MLTGLQQASGRLKLYYIKAVRGAPHAENLAKHLGAMVVFMRVYVYMYVYVYIYIYIRI